MASRPKYEIHLDGETLLIYQWCYPNKEQAEAAVRLFQREGYEAVLRRLTWTGWVVLTSKPV